MEISRHAKVRRQQRGIPKNLMDLIMEFGAPHSKPGGAIEYSIRKKDKNLAITYLKHLINDIDKTANKAILIKDNQIITVYHKKQ